MALDDFEGAEENFFRALDIDSNKHSALLNLAITYGKSGRFFGAEKILKHLLRVNPVTPPSPSHADPPPQRDRDARNTLVVTYALARRFRA